MSVWTAYMWAHTLAARTPRSTYIWTHSSNTPDTYVSNKSNIYHSLNIFLFSMKQQFKETEERRWTWKKEPLPIVAEECPWGPIKACFRGLPVMRASFSPVCPPHPWEHCMCLGPSRALPSLLCHPAESVTPGSKSKLNLILIHLIEEPDPKVEAVFDLLEGMERKDYGCLSYLGTI